MAFLYIQAAYDFVDRNMLWQKIREKGLDTRLTEMLRCMFDTSSTQIIVGSELITKILARARGEQGSFASPNLYNLYIDDLAQKLFEANIVMTSRGSLIPGCLYAGDVALICRTAAELQRALDICMSFSQERHFRWKPSKSKIISPPPLDPHMPGPIFTLYGEPLKVVHHFTYLGVIFGYRRIDINDQISMNIKRRKLRPSVLRDPGATPMATTQT